jgi:hypothetical protein
MTVAMIRPVVITPGAISLRDPERPEILRQIPL